jgi:short-subunit dehydrogenase
MTKSAVITGATHGIGKAIAAIFLANSYDIIICARNKDELNQLQNEWQIAYPNTQILAIPADFSNKDAVIAFADACKAFGKPINVLVNNAGIFLPGDIISEPDNQLEAMLQVNLLSAYHLTRKLLPAIQKSGSGAHIFNIASIASLAAYPGGSSYSISKYALLGFSDNLRQELSAEKIKVTAICPGPTYSRSWASAPAIPENIMAAEDIAQLVWAASQLSYNACTDKIVVTPV